MQAAASATGPELTIAFAATEYQLLCDAVAASVDGLALDLSGVTEFDSAGVQLLLATRRSLQDRSQALRIAAASPVVRNALATFGLQDLLPVPAAHS